MGRDASYAEDGGDRAIKCGPPQCLSTGIDTSTVHTSHPGLQCVNGAALVVTRHGSRFGHLRAFLFVVATLVLRLRLATSATHTQARQYWHSGLFFVVDVVDIDSTNRRVLNFWYQMPRRTEIADSASCFVQHPYTESYYLTLPSSI
jgi:hypothetical protein